MSKQFVIKQPQRKGEQFTWTQGRVEKPFRWKDAIQRSAAAEINSFLFSSPCSSTLLPSPLWRGGKLKRWSFLHLCSQRKLISSPGCDGKPRRGMKSPCIVLPLPANTKRKRCKKEEEKHQQLLEYARSRETKNECA